MTRWAGDNVVPLHRGRRAKGDKPPVGVQELIEAAQVFATLERDVAELASGAISEPAEGGSPVLRLRVRWPTAERWLARLDRISVADWPDATWALRMRSAQARAVERQRAVTESLYRDRLDVTMPPASFVDDAEDFAVALRELRELIAQFYTSRCEAH